MATFIITYDLRKSRDYVSLYSALKSYPQWARITESSWAVVANQSAVQIRDFLRQCMDDDDRLFVCRYGGAAAWKNLIASNEWFHNNLR